MDPPTPSPVRTSRLLLRLVEPRDAAATAALMTREVASNLSSWKYPTTIEDATLRIAAARQAAGERSAVNFAITHRLDGRLLGWLGVFVVDPVAMKGRLGYWIGSPFQGQGFATEAALAAVQQGAAFLRLRYLEAAASDDNLPSLAILRKLGMARTGTRLEELVWQGKEARVALFKMPLTTTGVDAPGSA
jgi:RimJ/RimL family protein N-acetyltransferase